MVLSDPLDKQSLHPILYAPQFRDRAGNTGNAYARAVMTSDGNIFPTHTFLTGGDFYANPINREDANYTKLLKAAPYLFYSIANMGSVIWYDTENDRFMNYATFGVGITSLKLNDRARMLSPGTRLVPAANWCTAKTRVTPMAALPTVTPSPS
ncbi:hypothetical protein MKQ70_26970 [Chitinophaga sedimenti]|uniref:hypothetical protein n=1 Tax=Chitinophaga sedimenti TaxID=2033606 RepID=UPI002004A8FA|nr:hypothetical protein [Chitinophaga sedimenti]MCK7558443.1 hypothetical protein [Chitinophaga sedimenti]